MLSDLERLENLIKNYRHESDLKKKHVNYLNLVDESLKLVKKIVSGVYPLPNTVTSDDLVQVGALGVLKAINSYNIETKGSFKTYATKVIKGQILHYLRDKANIVKPPRETVENLTKVKKALEEFEMKNLPITSEQIALHLNLPIHVVEEILNIEKFKNLVSLDQNVYTNEGTETLLDRLQGDDSYSYEDLYANKKIIDYAINKLPDLDKSVVTMYYLEDLSQKTISDELNISPTQVSRIIKRALNKLYLIIQKQLEENKE